MAHVGYAHLVDALGLKVRSPRQPASIVTSVNRRVTTQDRVLFPSGVALTDTPIGHLEFALRHEGIDLGILAAALPAIGLQVLVERLRENPNGEYVRRAAFLWEWLTGDELDCEARPTGRYINLFDPERHYTAPIPIRRPRYRVQDNALGDRRFCPVLGLSAYPGQDWLPSIADTRLSCRVGSLFTPHHLALGLSPLGRWPVCPRVPGSVAVSLFHARS